MKTTWYNEKYCGSTLIKITEQKARKPHWCISGSHTIHSGETYKKSYWYGYGNYPSGYYETCMCMTCWNELKEYKRHNK